MQDIDLKRQLLLLEMRIDDVMRKEVITVSPQNRMSELLTIFKKHNISGAPVIDGEKLVGIISIEDLIRWLYEGSKNYYVGERMTKNPTCFYTSQPLVYIIKIFEESGFGRFPVLNKSNKLAGIVTKGIIIKGLLKRLAIENSEDEIPQYRASHFFEDINADYKEINLRYNVIGKDIENAGSASTQIKRNLKRLGIRSSIIQRLAIASYEAEMNAVLHADGGTMEYTITPDQIICIARDTGPGIEDIEKAMQPGFSTASDWIRELGFGAGMGLTNIEKCSDKMEIDSTPGKGTTLTIIIRTEDNNGIKRNS
ncbi:MAG: CBS domain-containing protein [Spirochaetes bacterium]|nr:CBS domain-containing protein [Spirochaetota bacterium]